MNMIVGTYCWSVNIDVNQQDSQSDDDWYVDYFIINEIINSTAKIKTIHYKCTIIPTQYISFIYRSSLVLITLMVGIVFNVPNVLGIHLMFYVIVKMQ